MVILNVNSYVLCIVRLPTNVMIYNANRLTYFNEYSNDVYKTFHLSQYDRLRIVVLCLQLSRRVKIVIR